MKYVHVTAFISQTLYATQLEVEQLVRSKQVEHANAFNLIINKHNELKQQSKLLSRELNKTSEGAKVSRIFNSLSDALEFDAWYKNNMAAFNDLHVALGWTLETMNVITITDERWSEIEPIANVDIQGLVS